jgi:hypothetical protein
MLLRNSATGRPHDVPVAVVAPAVVAEPLTGPSALWTFGKHLIAVPGFLHRVPDR